ncbi:hypothetical protein ACTFIR_009117 [Dictyostelium discoideum]
MNKLIKLPKYTIANRINVSYYSTTTSKSPTYNINDDNNNNNNNNSSGINNNKTTTTTHIYNNNNDNDNDNNKNNNNNFSIDKIKETTIGLPIPVDINQYNKLKEIKKLMSLSVTNKIVNTGLFGNKNNSSNSNSNDYSEKISEAKARPDIFLDSKMIEFKFQEFMNTLTISNKSTLVISVSGGSDSMVLLYLLKNWCIGENLANVNRKLKITVITIDHKMTNPVAEDIPYISKIINQLINNDNNSNFIKIKHKVVEIDEQRCKQQVSLRNQRIEILMSESVGNGNNLIFYGTNLNDQMETFIQRINKNSGLDGLAAMTKITKISNTHSVLLVRPLLDFSKLEILDFCSERSIQYFHDPTNDDPVSYSRNKTRHQLRDFKEFSIESPLSTTINLKQFLSGLTPIRMIKDQTDKVLQKMLNDILELNEHKNNIRDLRLPLIRVPLDYYNSLPPTIQSRLLHRLSCIISNEFSFFQQKKYNQIVNSLKQKPNIPISSHKLFIYNEKILENNKPNHYLIAQPVFQPKKSNQIDLPINTYFKFHNFTIFISEKQLKSSLSSSQSLPPKLIIRFYDQVDHVHFDRNQRKIISSYPRYTKLLFLVIADASDNLPLCIPSIGVQTDYFLNNYSYTISMDKLSLNNIKTDWDSI